MTYKRAKPVKFFPIEDYPEGLAKGVWKEVGLDLNEYVQYFRVSDIIAQNKSIADEIERIADGFEIFFFWLISDKHRIDLKLEEQIEELRILEKRMRDSNTKPVLHSARDAK